MNALEVNADDTVGVSPLPHAAELQDYLLLFYTGQWREASKILADQQAMTENLHVVKAVGQDSAAALAKGDLSRFGELLNEQWRLKHLRCAESPTIQAWRTRGLAAALGCKLIGAGGGGFLLFYSETPKRLREIMEPSGMNELRFRFDYQGTHLMVRE